MRFHVERALPCLLGLFLCTAAVAQEPVTLPGEGLELRGLRYRADGAQKQPAIVMLHGCSGMWRNDGKPTATYDFWARHFQGRGFTALLLDSFGPRGEKEICTQQHRAVRPDRERVADVRAALRWLSADQRVDADRVFLMGWSNGGVTVLHAMGVASPGYRAAVAFYPGCTSLAKSERYKPGAPVLIQAGAADDWTPAKECEALASGAGKRGATVEIDVYPDAHHAFDRIDGRIRHRPDVRNPNSPTGRGATVGPHPEARRKALERTTAYLEAAAGAVPRGTSGPEKAALP